MFLCSPRICFESYPLLSRFLLLLFLAPNDHDDDNLTNTSSGPGKPDEIETGVKIKKPERDYGNLFLLTT